MDLKNIIEASKYSSNRDIDEYIKKLDKMSLLLDGNSLASITSFKFMLLQNENFFKNIELLKNKKIKGFEDFKIKPSYKFYNIYNYNIDLQRYIVSKQISLLNLDKNDENSVKYINNIFTLSTLFASENWEKHFLSTIISSTLYDTTKNSEDKKGILETFSQNVIFLKSLEKLYLSDSKKFNSMYSEILSIPVKNSYLYMIERGIKIDETKYVSKQNSFKNSIVEASYPYLFLNFSSFFESNLKKEYINKANKERFEKIKREYELTKSKQLLIELTKLSQQII